MAISNHEQFPYQCSQRCEFPYIVKILFFCIFHMISIYQKINYSPHCINISQFHISKKLKKILFSELEKTSQTPGSERASRQ